MELFIRPRFQFIEYLDLRAQTSPEVSAVMLSETVRRAADRDPRPIQDMRVNHRRGHIGMAE